MYFLQPMERWTGRIAMVTGAGGGIGGAIARALANNGMRVIVVDINFEKAKAVADEFAKNQQVFARQCDVTNEENVVRLVTWIRDTLGSGPDVLVNGAGVAGHTSIIDLDIARYRRTMDTNVFGTLLCTREVLADMRKRGIEDGHVININSILGRFLPELQGVYVYMASKHAVTVVTEALRRELRDLKSKIRVTNINPGSTRTDIGVNDGRFTPEQNKKYYDAQPSLEPEDITPAVIFALSSPPHVQIYELSVLPTGQLG